MTATVLAERTTTSGRRRRQIVLEPVQACPCCGEEAGECPEGCLDRKDRER